MRSPMNDQELELVIMADVARLWLRDISGLAPDQRAACAEYESVARETLRECTHELREREIDRNAEHAFDDKMPCK